VPAGENPKFSAAHREKFATKTDPIVKIQNGIADMCFRPILYEKMIGKSFLQKFELLVSALDDS